MTEKTLEWWRSDEARNHRLGLYLASQLLAIPELRKTPFGSEVPPPEYPAVWVYDPQDDSPKWVEVSAPIHAMDYALAYPDRLNPAAAEMARAGYAGAH